MKNFPRLMKIFLHHGAFAFIFILLAGTFSVRAAEYQWSVSVDSITLPNSSEHPRAFLWIPPDCKQVRGIVVGQNNMLEEGILQHPDFRRTLVQLGFAEIFIAPTFDTWQNTTNNDSTNKKFDALLKSLADESGYEELTFAPIIPIGHSAMASFPWNFAAWNPQRTLAILSVHGDAPQTDLVGNGRPNVNWGDRNINGIPGLMVMGEYEWWEKRLSPAFVFEEKYPATPVAFLCDAGNGHFNSSDELVDFLGIFLRKAAEERLPKNTPLGQPIKLKFIDPHDGWLIDRWHRDQPPSAPAAPYDKYTGNHAETFWCFDKEMARATEKYYARQRGKLPQLADFVQDGKTIPIDPKAFELVRLKFPPLDATLTFHLQGTFLEMVPPGNPQTWTGLTNGTPIGHAPDDVPVGLSRITGPVEQLSPDTFAIRFNRLSMPFDRRMGDIWLVAKNPGDAKYKSAVEQALMKIPFRLSEGAEQKITFPKIPDQKAGTKSVKLNATSDAGVPVYYYVREGPAEIRDEVLKFTKIPPRAKFPVKVTVVAWQYGRTIEPKLKSAEPVVQEFFITK
jgi:hypothetical protein